jgi:hypothetical protein
MSQYYALTRFLKHRSSCFLFFYLISFAVLNVSLFLSAGKAYSGQATLFWDAPTTNADGTPLTDIEGYKEYYGPSPGNYNRIENIGMPPCNVVDGKTVCTDTIPLSDGYYCFVVTAYDTSDNESEYSNEVCKTISSTQQYTLTVTKSGTGSGTITSIGINSGINCGSDCTEPYNQGTIVTLTAAAAAGSAFTIWSGGGCTGAGTCSTTINAKTTVTANFNKTYAIEAKAGTGGNISPSGKVTVNEGANQTFTITSNTGYRVADVMADGSSVGTVSTYSFNNVTANHSIGATFALDIYSGQATLSWNPPTTNADGTPLTDLKGYKVYYGTLSGNYLQNIDAGNVTTYTVANLSEGTYYFAVTAYDISRNESAYSNEVSKTIQPVQ